MAGNMVKPFNFTNRIKTYLEKVVTKYGLKEEQIHMGHLILECLYGDPEYIQQIDAATDEKQTNLEVAALSARLADAMKKSGLKPGDHVVVMGPNNIFTTLPIYACHYSGYSLCTLDPSNAQAEIEAVFSNVRPKLVFCSSPSIDVVKKAMTVNNLTSRVVTFQGEYNLDAYIEEFKGSEIGYEPELFDVTETNALLVLTSGSTGMPKVVVITFDCMYKNIAAWLTALPFKTNSGLAMSSIQWLSSIIYYVTTPFLGNTRIQTSAAVTPAHLREIFTKYRPNNTTFAPHVLQRFLEQEGDACDLSCLIHVGLTGGPVSNDLVLKLKEKCKAIIQVVYSMTETLAMPFIYAPNTPLGSVGVAIPKFTYKLVDDDGNEIKEPNKVGELWWKGGYFFKEYLNNPEETAKTLTKDGWIKTGDLLSRDENNFYYFHERKKLLIKYQSVHVIPLEIENVIKEHLGVLEAVVVGVPHPRFMELPTAAILKKKGAQVDPQEIFDSVNKELPPAKRLHGGIFFVDEYPVTASDKINRPAIVRLAQKTNTILDKNL